MPDYLFIVNPSSDRWRAGKRWARVEAALKARGVNYDVVFTKGPGHALALAEAAARGGNYGAVVSVGGDGTLNETVNGLCRAAGDRETIPLAAFPVGSGNDFATVIGMSRKPERMVEQLLTEGQRLVDVGLLHSPDVLGPTTPYRYFINTSGIGFEAQVNLESRRIQRLQGFLIYLVAVFRALVRFQQPFVEAQWDDGERRERMLLLTVGNGRRAGGGFWLTPMAEVDDGLLDVGFAKELGRVEILKLLPKAIKGTHIYDPAFDIVRTARLRIRTDIHTPAHTDGEAIIEGTRELDIEVLPKKVRVIADPNRPLKRILKDDGR